MQLKVNYLSTPLNPLISLIPFSAGTIMPACHSQGEGNLKTSRVKSTTAGPMRSGRVLEIMTATFLGMVDPILNFWCGENWVDF